MTNPTDINETTADRAQKVFSELRTVLFSFEESAKRGEVEGVHDMRVTARKLRVAIANFATCLPVERRRAVKGRLTELADALGRVRDIDVMLESLVEIEAESPETRKPMLADLRARLKRRHRYHQKRLSVYFASESYQALKQTLAELTHGQAT